MTRTSAVLTLLLLAAASPAAETFRLDIAELAPFRREVDEGGSLTFSVTLKPGWFGPIFSMTRPSGETKYFRPARQTGPARHEFDVIFDAGPGAYRMELVVDSVKGDHSAAQFSIFAGVKAPPRGEAEARRPESDYPPERADEDPVRLERDFFRMVNEYRGSRGLPCCTASATVSSPRPHVITTTERNST